MLAQKGLHLAAGVRKQRLVNEIDRSGRTFDVQQENADACCVRGLYRQAHSSARGRTWRNVSRPPAHGLVAAIHTAIRIVRRPPALVLEQANRADAPVAAQ